MKDWPPKGFPRPIFPRPINWALRSEFAAIEDSAIEAAAADNRAGLVNAIRKLRRLWKKHEQEYRVDSVFSEPWRSLLRLIARADRMPPDDLYRFSRELELYLRLLPKQKRWTRAEQIYEQMQSISKSEGLKLWSKACARRAAEIRGLSVSYIEDARKDGSRRKRERLERWKRSKR